MKIKKYGEFHSVNEGVEVVFYDASKKDAKVILDRILKAKSLNELEDIDLAFDEVIKPYGKRSESEILNDIKKKAQEHFESIPVGYNPVKPADYQRKVSAANSPYFNKNVNLAYKNWD